MAQGGALSLNCIAYIVQSVRKPDKEMTPRVRRLHNDLQN
jgi:hypothetical protein